MNEALSLKTLLGTSESELAELTAHVDFRVLLEGRRYLIVEVSHENLGPYPDTHIGVVTLDLATGRPLGIDAFAKGKRGGLLRLLNARISAAWAARKEELKKAPAQGDDCASVFSGDSGGSRRSGATTGPVPKVSREKLAQVYVTAEGLRFPFRFEFPRAIQACEPTVDLVLPWSEAAAYIEPTGPLARR